jgi:hypothetical protein
MRASTTAFAFLSILGLSSAVPTPVDLAPRCGTTLLPSFIQKLDESNPTTVAPSSNDFLVSQGFDAKGHAINRVYQVVAFENIPAGANACQLNVQFPTGYTITTTGNPTLNVTTLFKDTPSSIVSPNNWSWNTFFPPTSPPFGQGLFGTVNLAAPQTTAINSEVCPPGGGDLAFVFEIASWVWGAASVEFTQASNAGVYLTFNC